MKKILKRSLAAFFLSMTLFSGNVHAQDQGTPAVPETSTSEQVSNIDKERADGQQANGQVQASTQTILTSSNIDERYVTSIELPVYRSFEELSDYRLHLGPEYTRFAELKYNDKVIVLKEDQYAAEILMPDGKTVGWIHKDYLSTNILDQSWLLKEERNLREEPNTSSEVVVKIPSGAKIHVLDYDPESNFYQVKTEEDKVGWIYGFYIVNGALTDEGNNLIIYEFGKSGTIENLVTVFTPLDSVSTITVDEINRFIYSKTNGKETLMSDMGSAFIDAQAVAGLNAMYLVAHSGLEAGWGTSVIVNEKYNYFGIGANDLNPVDDAYNFDNPQDGIVAGALWINKYYVDRVQGTETTFIQPTLDNMRNNGDFHQFSTDEAWAVKIAYIAKELYNYTFENSEGFYQEGDNKYYFGSDGRMKTGWQTIENKHYFFEKSGTMKKGWHFEQNSWYFLDQSNGYMSTGWILNGNKWYYLSPENGVMQKGWLFNGGSWYYLNADGAMNTGWLFDGRSWYYLDVNGAMNVGWRLDSGQWYYLNPNGIMATGWLQDGSVWYYLDKNGVMITGWITSGGKYYYLDKNGRMVFNTVIDGYRIGSDGAWIH